MFSRTKRMRLWTYLLDAPVVAVLTFVFFFLMDKPNRNLGACLTGVVCIGLIPLSAWFHMVRHPGDYKGERKVAFVLSIVGYMIGTIVMVVFFRQARLFLALMLSYMFTFVGLVIINLLVMQPAYQALRRPSPSGMVGQVQFRTSCSSLSP